MGEERAHGGEGESFCRPVGMTVVPQARWGLPPTSVSLPAKSGQRHVPCLAVGGAMRRLQEGGGCGGAQPASGSVCPSCCASGARAAALLFLTVRLTHNLPLLGWVFRLRKAFSSSENSDSQTWESPRHQGLALLTRAAWRVSPTAWGPLLYAPPELLFQGLLISGFSQRTEDIRTKQKAEHGKGQGPAASMDRCGFRS